MAKTYSWSHSYSEAFQETEDNQILDATLSVTIDLLWRWKRIGLNTFGPEQLAIKTALYPCVARNLQESRKPASG
jgi:hypothetical protein